MTLDEILKEVRVGERTVIDVAGEGKDRHLTVELRKLLPEEARPPTRAESPARKHEFLAAQSLADYLARYGSKDTTVYADPINEVIHAVVNERQGDGYEVVTMRPAPHPMWSPWAAIAGKSLPLGSFVMHVDQNRRAIIAPDSRDLRLLLSQVRASVKITVERGRGKTALNGLMVQTEIQGVTKSEAVELPETITLNVPLYVDSAAKNVELDLCIEADRSGDITVLVSAGTVAEARVKAFEEMVATIREGTKALGCVTTFGRPQYRGWDYLPEQATK